MKKLKLLLFVLMLPLLTAAQSVEECMKKGDECYDKKDYGNAFAWYKKAADQGYAKAQSHVGQLYYYGEGVSKDYKNARVWFEKAANQGYAFAQYMLGYINQYGKGVKNDSLKAAEWYQKAADQGNAAAQNELGMMYVFNTTNTNYPKAIELFKKAANQGNTYAQCNLGYMYQEGYAVTRDYAKALDLYHKAADKGLSVAQYRLGIAYSYGFGVAIDENKALEWFQKAANQGYKSAEFSVRYLREKLKEKKDVAQAAKVESPSQTIVKETKKEEPKTIVQEKPKEQSKTVAQAKPKEAPKPVAQPKPKEQPKQTTQTQVATTIYPKNEIDPVDNNIPMPGRVNRNTFAIIIANENYSRETKVDYARNDGEVFKNYCHKTLGLPEKNVHFMPDATLNDLIGELDWLSQVCKAFKGEASVIFYYAGHGIPDEASGSAYLLPTDGNSRLLRTCFSINELYETLGSLPAKKVTVLMDACFSGAKRSGDMMASARGVAIKAKMGAPKGSMIVLSAAKGDETAYKYEDAKHGLFTYFLLKKLKDSKGNVTLGELSRYIQDQVGRYSIVENGKSQTPTVQASDNLKGRWESMMFE